VTFVSRRAVEGSQAVGVFHYQAQLPKVGERLLDKPFLHGCAPMRLRDRAGLFAHGAHLANVLEASSDCSATRLTGMPPLLEIVCQ